MINQVQRQGQQVIDYNHIYGGQQPNQGTGSVTKQSDILRKKIEELLWKKAILINELN